MNNLNSILIEGNLVRDPEIRETPKGTPVCTFSVASNRFYKQNDTMEKEVSFFDIETWSQLAQNCGKSLHKGRGVRIVGRLKQERWTGTDGKPFSKIKIVAEHVEFKSDSSNRKEKEEEKAEVPKLAAQAAEGQGLLAPVF